MASFSIATEFCGYWKIYLSVIVGLIDIMMKIFDLD